MTKIYKNLKATDLITEKEAVEVKRKETKTKITIGATSVVAPLVIVGTTAYVTKDMDDVENEPVKQEEIKTEDVQNIQKQIDVKLLGAVSPEQVVESNIEGSTLRYSLPKENGIAFHAPVNGSIKDGKLYTDNDLEIELDGIKLMKDNVKVKAGDVIGENSSKEVSISMIHDEIDNINLSKVDENFNYKFKQAKEFKSEVVATDHESEKILNSADETVKESVVLKGVTLENKNQASLVNSNDVYYSDSKLLLETLKGGKADVHPENRKLEPIVRKYMKEYGIEEYTESFLAILEKENGGNIDIIKTDPAQSSQSKNGVIGSISNQEASIKQGVKHYHDVLTKSGMFNEPEKQGDVRYAIQAYNFGSGLGRDALNDNVHYNVDYVKRKAVEYLNKTDRSKLYKMGSREWRGEAQYGDFTYVAKYFNIFTPDKVHEIEYETDVEVAINVVEVEEEPKEEIKADDVVKVSNDTNKDKVEEKKENKEETVSKGSSSSYERLLTIGKERGHSRGFINSLEAEREHIEKLDSVFDKGPTNKPYTHKQLKDKIIIVDAGHGGHDPGASSGNKITEKELALKHAFAVKESLESMGAKVVMSRTGDNFVKIPNRIALVKQHNADAFISMHLNSAGNYEANGFEILYHFNSPVSKQFADKAASHLKNDMTHVNQRANKAHKGNAYESAPTNVGRPLGVFNGPKDVPTILVEAGFMQTTKDMAYMTHPNAITTMGNSIANGLADVIGSEVTIDKVETTENTEFKEKVDIKEDNKVVEDKVKDTEVNDEIKEGQPEEVTGDKDEVKDNNDTSEDNDVDVKEDTEVEEDGDEVVSKDKEEEVDEKLDEPVDVSNENDDIEEDNEESIKDDSDGESDDDNKEDNIEGGEDK